MLSWKSLPFEQCVEPVAYTTKVQRKDFLADGAYPIVSQEDAFINGFWDNEPDVFRVERPIVVFGDHTRTLKYIDFDFVLGADGVKILKPKLFLHPRFFFYQLHTAKLNSLGYARHYRLLKEHQVAFPAYAEQQRIVAILDEAFEAIATAKANVEKSLQQIGELFEYAMHLLVEQPGVPIAHLPMADVCEIRSKLVDPREEPYLDQLHVGAANIVSKTGELVDVLTARQEQLISGKFEFDDSMVLYSKIRPYLMKVVRPDFSGLCSADIYPLMPKPGVISRDFLYYTLLSSAFTDYAIKGSARAGMPKVNRDHLFAYQMSLPPVEVQGQITRKLDALADNVESMQGIYARKLAALDELKKSLLHQAFSGQV
ncbi:MAG TPA: restriction endonuclease subunit S [Aquabacterium sp.]|nr:restriction endonuclease subunit S [Aquabacterium sp.]HRH27494.1 restriction endonuclease subunit S [Aquabacterium sp.]